MKQTLMLAFMATLPLRYLTITSSYGHRIHLLTGKWAFHAGIDLRARSDTVFAIMDGVVITAAYDNSLGSYVGLNHGSIQSLYGHLSQIFVKPGDTVRCGQPIAKTGATGRVTGGHLHFAVLYGNKPLDPLRFLYQVIINPNQIENHE
jgi:murein DD-endopeptidase MepM/ murein hydrolase activator NlpD